MATAFKPQWFLKRFYKNPPYSPIATLFLRSIVQKQGKLKNRKLILQISTKNDKIIIDKIAFLSIIKKLNRAIIDKIAFLSIIKKLNRAIINKIAFLSIIKKLKGAINDKVTFLSLIKFRVWSIKV